jgi:hypothetical protein
MEGVPRTWTKPSVLRTRKPLQYRPPGPSGATVVGARPRGRGRKTLLFSFRQVDQGLKRLSTRIAAPVLAGVDIA